MENAAEGVELISWTALYRIRCSITLAVEGLVD